MSIVIIGGNERMVRQYKDICSEYDCQSKILIKMTGNFQNKIGTPDILVLFTSTISHKMVRSALCEIKGLNTIIVRSHSSSMNALKGILNEYA